MTQGNNATQTKIIMALIDQHKNQEGPLLPILHAIQDELGYLPDDATALVAEVLNLSAADVHGVISFYHYFRTTPPAAHRLQYCRAEACQAMGSTSLENLLKERFGIDPEHGGQTEHLTLEPVYCMGNCARPPSMRLDGELHSRMTADKLSQWLNQVEQTS